MWIIQCIISSCNVLEICNNQLIYSDLKKLNCISMNCLCSAGTKGFSAESTDMEEKSDRSVSYWEIDLLFVSLVLFVEFIDNKKCIDRCLRLLWNVMPNNFTTALNTRYSLGVEQFTFWLISPFCAHGFQFGLTFLVMQRGGHCQFHAPPFAQRQLDSWHLVGTSAE